MFSGASSSATQQQLASTAGRESPAGSDPRRHGTWPGSRLSRHPPATPTSATKSATGRAPGSARPASSRPSDAPRPNGGPSSVAGPSSPGRPATSLDDMAQRHQIPGRPDHVQRLVQLLLEPSPVGARQSGTDQLDPPRQLRTDRRLGTAHTMVPRVQTSLPLRSGTEPAPASLHAVLAAARQGQHRATGTEADGRVAESDSAGIEPTTARTRSLARSSHGQADAAPGTLLKRFLDERRARRGRHPFWRCAAVAGWRDVVRCGMPLEAATVRPI